MYHPLFSHLHPFCICVGNIQVVFCKNRSACTKAHIYHLCAIIYRVADSIGNILIMLIAIRHSTYHHDAHIICHAIHTFAIVSQSADNS